MLPVPVLPPVTVIQLALLVVLHAHPLVVVTVAVPDPPAVVMLCVSGATEKLTRDYGASCTWQGDNLLKVSRKGLDALVTVGESNVHIDMNLGFLLTPFAEKIKSGIAKQLSGILAAAPGN